MWRLGGMYSPHLASTYISPTYVVSSPFSLFIRLYLLWLELYTISSHKLIQRPTQEVAFLSSNPNEQRGSGSGPFTVEHPENLPSEWATESIRSHVTACRRRLVILWHCSCPYHGSVLANFGGAKPSLPLLVS